MFESKLEKFMVKRVFVLIIILSIVDMIIMESKWLVLVGLMMGTILSIAKFSLNARIFSGNLCTHKSPILRKLSSSANIILFTIIQITLFLLLFLSYSLSPWIFAGFVAGVLLIPFAIMINSVTEALGLTKNHFE